MSKSENTIILLKDFNDSKPIHENIVSMAVIGSYNTKFWIKNRSDIDVLILIKSKRD
ncbi:nucleotidyltransferase domain-containing protein, partial [Phocaeicola dorei]|uniref:nucleotidyltransferase domain-containing protein n=1 Tax=Phocaeicola dorei TaxID=357276 RepID=UPI00374E0785